MLVFCTVLIAFKYKTAVENNQNLILEGVYIPLDWAKDFDAYYRQSISLYLSGDDRTVYPRALRRRPRLRERD